MVKYLLPVLAVAVMFGGLAVASADAGHGCYNTFYGPSYGGHVWHDTSHWDYHPGGFLWHGNHIDYVPGHYDWHNSGHFDHYHW